MGSAFRSPTTFPCRSFAITASSIAHGGPPSGQAAAFSLYLSPLRHENLAALAPAFAAAPGVLPRESDFVCFDESPPHPETVNSPTISATQFPVIGGKPNDRDAVRPVRRD